MTAIDAVLRNAAIRVAFVDALRGRSTCEQLRADTDLPASRCKEIETLYNICVNECDGFGTSVPRKGKDKGNA